MSATNPLTIWRTALADLLAARFPDATVLAGERAETPSKDKDVICVFWPGLTAAGDVNFARPKMTIRFWKGRPSTTVFSQPEVPDDAPLEQAGWDLAQALQPVRTSLVVDDAGNTLIYFELAQLLPVRDQNAVEAHLIGWANNPAAIAVP